MYRKRDIDAERSWRGRYVVEIDDGILIARAFGVGARPMFIDDLCRFRFRVLL